MPRLPSSEALGGLPEANSRRPIATFDTTAPGVAMQAVGQGIANLGQGIAAGLRAYEARTTQQDELDERTAASQREVNNLNLLDKANQSNDPNEIRGLTAELQKNDESYLGRIRDPQRRQEAAAKIATDTARYNIKFNDRARDLDNKNFVDGMNNEVEDARRKALDSSDPDVRAAAQRVLDKKIEEAVARRILTPDEAIARKRKWNDDFAWDTIKLLPPEQRAYAAGGLEGALIGRESSGNPSTVNQFGFAGLYQFGAPRLQTLGIYSPGSSEDMGGWNKSGKGAPGKWSGSFNIPGFPQVKSVQDFLANPAAQRKAWEVHNAYMDQEIQSRGLDAYIGQTVGGVTITRDGIKAMIHLGGIGNAKKVLDSGGSANPSDANGTSLLNYAAMAAKGGNVQIGQALPPERRREALDSAYREIAQQQSQALKVAAAEQAVRLNAIEVGAHDGTVTRADLARLRENGELPNDYDAIAKVERIIEAREKKEEAERAYTEIASGQRPANPADPEDRKAIDAGVDLVFKGANGKLSKPQAAMAVWEKTGGQYLPKSAAAAIRGDLNSTDPATVAATMQVIANMLRRNPRAFVGAEGAKDIEEAYTRFQVGTENLGQTPEIIAQKYIESQNTGQKVKVSDQAVKDFGDMLDKSALSDLENATFTGSHWFYDNNAGPPANRSPMVQDFKELAKEHFAQHGDPAAAKKYAATQLNKMYGVSNGKLTKFPAEMAYPPINNSHEYVYDQALEAIKAYAPDKAKDLKREDITLGPLPNMRTSAAFLAGRRTPYQIFFTTKVDGVPVTHSLWLPNGAEFQPDPVSGREMMTAKRAAEFEKKRVQPPAATAPAAIPSVSAADVGERSMRPGRPVRTQAEREAIAKHATDDTQARANQMFKQEQERKALEAATKKQMDEANAAGATIKSATPSAKELMKRAQEDQKIRPGKPKYDTGGSF